MARIGEIKCCNPACACADAAVHRTAGGKLSARCHKCGTERWAPVGTKAHRDMLAQTTLDDQAEEPESSTLPAPAPAPAAVTKPMKRASVPFALGNL
ncbi:hypothetical protein AVHY2522_22885 [Acidovorax sp. SUPP2522]|uniref:hypothetical protein n=1 Tax=unclassified Acidovorax TaxID=2684926 RepID=UPI0023493075|nr:MULTISPECIES: hypothetical protein [unclassified Acidovorax]WCM95727.1 hypothetical protein M5C96_14690 [Acidovorax sp. GBBC 1281]GKT19550.1 hypothetical protein AVHY2522_22885 [Acidovorax sp. SUPP2522]